MLIQTNLDAAKLSQKKANSFKIQFQRHVKLTYNITT